MENDKTKNSENLDFDNFKKQIYFKNGNKDVHYTFEQLKIKGNLYKTDLIWYEGLERWTKVSDIFELSSIALSRPPLTKKEKNLEYLKKSLKPSLIIYTLFSVILGIFAGLIEKNQYEDFFREIKANEIANEKEDIQRYGIDYKTNPNLNSNGFSYVRENEIYLTRKDGTRYTRWVTYLVGRGIDQEQVSYNNNFKFLFRPYIAILKNAYLSKDERENVGLLLSNFVFSSLVTNLLIIPFIIFGYFIKSKKENTSDEEFNSKIKKQKNEQKIANSQSYKKLKNLFETGFLTKEEFESKVKNINLIDIDNERIRRQDKNVEYILLSIVVIGIILLIISNVK